MSRFIAMAFLFVVWMMLFDPSVGQTVLMFIAMLGITLFFWYRENSPVVANNRRDSEIRQFLTELTSMKCFDISDDDLLKIAEGYGGGAEALAWLVVAIGGDSAMGARMDILEAGKRCPTRIPEDLHEKLNVYYREEQLGNMKDLAWDFARAIMDHIG
ncbi:hypothetical protein CL614_00735 [archaeon]|nr:hypothetical protein [archaeon]|tara:strand:- start:490 stop:963 length:474 start_codon:yes stop_codon:yes gene_type:complete